MWWTCDQCPDGHPHEWQAAVHSRSDGNGCPYCASRKVCHHNSLSSKNPAVAAQWSDKNQLSPSHYAVSSGQKMSWRCNYGHEWQATIASRTRNGTGCPACSQSRKRGRSKQRHPVLAESQHDMMHYWDKCTDRVRPRQDQMPQQQEGSLDLSEVP